MPKPTLNQADLDLMKKIFATKKDLSGFATKKDLVILATKEDLQDLEARLKKFTKDQLDEFSVFLTQYFENIKLENTLLDHEKRIKQIEEITPGLPS